MYLELHWSLDVKSLQTRIELLTMPGEISHSVNQSSVGGSRSDIVDSIKDLAFPSTNKEFALSYADTFVDDGWSVYNPQREYKRQNIDKNTGWQVTNYNERWEICETYPEVLVVPNEVSKEELTEVAAFRSKNRVTVLSWISKEGAAICRCSQPLRGPQVRIVQPTWI